MLGHGLVRASRPLPWATWLPDSSTRAADTPGSGRPAAPGLAVSYLPGRKVAGVVVGDGRVTVQVRSRWGVPAPDLAALIAAVLAPLTGHRPVDVVIADIDDPPGIPSFPVPTGVGPSWPDAGLPPV